VEPKSARDSFFASPQFPRLLNPDSIKDTIARGVENGMLGYVGKKVDGSYEPFYWVAVIVSLPLPILINASLPPLTSMVSFPLPTVMKLSSPAVMS
jgi:hypothetical protein